MRPCPLCGRPVADRPGLPGPLPCDRCAGAIDVSRALEVLGPVPRPRRPRPLAWIAGGASILLAGAVMGFLLPAKPPEPAADRAAPLLAEARRRMEGPVSRAGWEGIERLLREAEAADPARVETRLLRAESHLERGAEGAAHAAFDEVLAREPGNVEALAGKGERVVTSQLLLHLDRLRWPEVTRALAARLAQTQGRAFDALAARLDGPAAAFARASAAVARADWAGAQRALDPVPRESLPVRLRDAVGPMMFVVDYLEDPRLPMPAAWAGRIQGEEGASAARGEREVWLALVRHLERRAFLARLPVVRNPRHPAHAALLRAEAALHETRGDVRKAEEALAEAIAAAPDYLQARLARAAALSKAGDAAGARREAEAARALALAWGLPDAAIREIREGP
jgi:tetratricopeptide (TPR) repeat protein